MEKRKVIKIAIKVVAISVGTLVIAAGALAYSVLKRNDVI